MTSWSTKPLSLPVRLTYSDGRSETVRLVYAGCTADALMVEGDRLIPRSLIRSSGITFDFSDGAELLAA